MKCSKCHAVMRHLGYFLWGCDSCGHRCRGELPLRTIGSASRRSNPGHRLRARS